MTLATTSSIWRSTGGDQTRTATAGSMDMSATFYIADVTASANVKASASSNASVILPAGAVVTSVIISTASAGGNSAVNVGFTPLINVGPGQSTTLGTNVPQAFVASGNVAARTLFTVGTATGGASLGNVANATNLVIVTSAIGAAGAAGGNVSGIIKYFVPTNGAENV